MPPSTRRQALTRLSPSRVESNIEVVDLNESTDELPEEDAENGEEIVSEQELEEDDEPDGRLATQPQLLIHHTRPPLTRLLRCRSRRRAISATRPKRNLLTCLLDSQHREARKWRSSPALARYSPILAVRRSSTTFTEHPLLQASLNCPHANIPRLPK